MMTFTQFFNCSFDFSKWQKRVFEQTYDLFRLNCWKASKNEKGADFLVMGLVSYQKEFVRQNRHQK